MPHYDMTPTVKVEVVTGRFKLFHDTVEGVRAGTVTPEQLGEFLETQYGILQGLRADIEGIIEGTDYMAKAAEEMNQGIQGMDHFEAGVHEMWAYLEDGEFEHLEAGLDLVRIGNDFINDAKRINRVNRQKLEDDWGKM